MDKHAHTRTRSYSLCAWCTRATPQAVNSSQRLRVLLLRHLSPQQANQLLLLQDGAEDSGAVVETEEDLVTLFGRVGCCRPMAHRHYTRHVQCLLGCGAGRGAQPGNPV